MADVDSRRRKMIADLTAHIKGQYESGEITGQNAAMNVEGVRGMPLSELESFCQRVGIEVSDG